ncbi:MAG: UvrD-helicase domain-containing protein, partial [Deltaproteobacteria bacterium]|nr:UvrD-helicase domain-containing protein [Deltaproteobacteria bacterium]
MLSQLNPKQREAVLHTEGPLLVLAGAGSGKTRVLAYRMAWLLRKKNIRPWNLFAVTFTNKAAGEMKGRVEKLLGGVAQDIWVSTFHSACLRILRRHAEALGYGRDFTIYDDRDQLTLITRCLEELNINPQRANPKAVAHRINQAKHNALLADDIKPAEVNPFETRVASVYGHYQQKLLANQAMDFGDLLLNVVLLFRKNPEILVQYQNQFAYVMVDEYQDTNRAQYELIRLLAGKHKNLCVVGDDDQSIYKFRGAEIKNILDFQKDYPEARVIRLEQNYRSTGFILKAASAVVANNRGRLGKTLWTENGAGERLTLFEGLTETDEAVFTADQIDALRGRYRLADMAVFYRTNAQSRPFEDELRRRDIPYAIIGGTKFYDRQEIRDMVAYVKLLVNPADSISLKRIINVPARGIGKTTVEKLEKIAGQQGSSLWDVIVGAGSPRPGEGTSPLQPSIISKLNPFITLIQTLKNDLQQMLLVDFMTHLYEKTGYWKMLQDEKTIEAEGRMENLEELVNVVEEYCQREESPTLEGFLDQAALVSDADDLNPEADRLPLMTFHLAKGLEFPVVFMVGMEEGLFPHSRSLDAEKDVEEERRLCYVGMTRAREKLFLSFVNYRRLFGSSQYAIPSRFLDEIPEDLLEKISQKKIAGSMEDEEESSIDYDFDQRPACEVEASSARRRPASEIIERTRRYDVGERCSNPPLPPFFKGGNPSVSCRSLPASLDARAPKTAAPNATAC